MDKLIDHWVAACKHVKQDWSPAESKYCSYMEQSRKIEKMILTCKSVSSNIPGPIRLILISNVQISRAVSEITQLPKLKIQNWHKSGSRSGSWSRTFHGTAPLIRKISICIIRIFNLAQNCNVDSEIILSKTGIQNWHKSISISASWSGVFHGMASLTFERYPFVLLEFSIWSKMVNPIPK